MVKGTIFDIKRYAIHDGPGIRTTIFFKGCPLRCQWCHNPEGQESKPEIMVRSGRCVEKCTECLLACPSGAISKDRGSVRINQAKCDYCGKCKEVCVYDALDIIGQEFTVQELVDEIEKDRIFFDESRGGITFSGGEPLMQPDFLEALLVEFKKRGIHNAVDTSGYASLETLDRISRNIDLFLYDIKIMDGKKHKEYIGTSNNIILKNLRKLSEKGQLITVRIPLVKGINDDEENIRGIGEYLLSLNNIKNVDLLSYQKSGCEKHKRLQRATPALTFKVPSSERLKTIKKILSEYGFSVKIGG